MADNTMLIVGGGIALLGAVALFKPDLFSQLGLNLGSKEDDEVPEDPAPLPDAATEPVGGTAADAASDLSQRTIIVDYYAGKVAQSCTTVAERNIYEWREIKNLIIEKYVGAVADIAELNSFQIKQIDENNLLSIRKYSALVLRVCNDMGIRIKSAEKQALEGIAGVQPTVPPAQIQIPQVAKIVRIRVKRVIDTPAPPPPKIVNPKIYIKVRDRDRRRGGRFRFINGTWTKANKAFYFPDEAMPRLTMA